MENETEQVHQQRLSEAVQEMQDHLMESVANRIMGSFPPDTRVQISVDESVPSVSERIREAEAMAEAAHNAPDPHMDYRARMTQLEHEYREARDRGDRHHIEMCAREMERLSQAMREFDERRNEMTQVERMREDLRRLRERRPPWGESAQRRRRDEIRQLESDLRAAEVRERAVAPPPRNDSPWGTFDFGELERRYVVSRDESRSTRRMQQEINRVHEQISVNPDLLFDPERYSTITGRFAGLSEQLQTRPRHGSDRREGEPTDFVVHGIDVEGRDNTPNDRIFFWGVRTGNSPWVVMIQGESIDTAFFRGLREYEAQHGRRPFRARMNSERQREFGRTPMRPLDPEPQTNETRTDQMQGPYKLHLTTRDGFKKTVTQDSPFVGSYYVTAETMPMIEGFGGPSSTPVRERRYEYTKKAVFTDLQTGAMTEQRWAVERG